MTWTRNKEGLLMSVTPEPPRDPHGLAASVPRGASVLLHLLGNPLLVATIVAFGPSLLLIYTAAVEWPRQTDRFYAQMQEQRDLLREDQQANREQMRALLAIQQQLSQQHTQTLAALQALQKVLSEMWFRIQELMRKQPREEGEIEWPPTGGPA